ncbi:MAG: DUF2683 family protein [Ginsengibacter sp.]
METITIHPKSKEDLQLFEQLATRLKAPFKTKKGLEREKAIKLYGKIFVEKIEASEKNFKEGKYKIIKTEDLWK